MNHSLPGMKQTKSFTHLTPIAPAPLIAPRPVPVQVLPKPVASSSSTPPATAAAPVASKPMSTSSSTTSMADLETQSLPCIITSKQWVLPPRPKAGRKPSNPDKKKAQQQQQHHHHHQLPTAPPTLAAQKRQNSVTSVTNNMGNLNIHKSLSENISLAPSMASSASGSTITTLAQREDLKTQLDSATQENQKLKSIISWLKIEIEQLQQTQQASMSPNAAHAANTLALSPHSITLDAQTTAAQIHYQLHGTMVSTPAASQVSLTSREVSPSTVDPREIGMVKPRQKRQYKKKKKKAENTPSPISVALESNAPASGLPAVETMITDPATHQHQSKRTKTAATPVVRSVDEMLSPATHSEFELNHVSALSRTTTNTTLDPLEFGWPGRDCGFCQDGGPCLCLEKSRSLKETENTIVEERSDELDVNELFKSDANELDEFLML